MYQCMTVLKDIMEQTQSLQRRQDERFAQQVPTEIQLLVTLSQMFVKQVPNVLKDQN